MDPDKLLDELREAVAKLQDGDSTIFAAAEQVAAKFHELDYWLCEGGAFPEDWRG